MQHKNYTSMHHFIACISTKAQQSYQVKVNQGPTKKQL